MQLSRITARKDRFEDHANIVREGLGSMAAVLPKLIDANKAYAIIRDEKLWDLKYKSWEECCDKEFGKSRQAIEKTLLAVGVLKSLPPAQAKQVKSVNAAKQLGKLPPPKRVEAVKEAAKGGAKVTEKTLKAAITKVSGPPAKQQKPKDKTGYEIPSNLYDLWDRGQEAEEYLRQISGIKSAAKKAQETEDPLWAEVMLNDFIASLDGVYNKLKQCIPFAVCTTCSGHPDLMKQCCACKGRGIVSKFKWDTVVPMEDKELRAKSVSK